MPSSKLLRPESRKRLVVSASLLIPVALVFLGAIAGLGWFGYDGFVTEASVLKAVPPVESAAAFRRTAAAAVKFDFDGDGKADVSRARVVASPTPAVHEVRFRDSGDGTFADYLLAVSSGKIAPGDFNGDGKTDAAIFNNGTWTYKTSTGGSAQTISLGTTGDIPVAADYDGDVNHTTDAAVFRPSTGVWYVKESSTSTQ